jgi:hypothetical protein
MSDKYIDPIEVVIILIILILIIHWIVERYHDNKCRESFGALQSLYSNDGIQDTNLTVPDERSYYDPYKYWRSIAWNLPTRNLDRTTYVPYLYENYVDRYTVPWPYW